MTVNAKNYSLRKIAERAVKFGALPLVLLAMVPGQQVMAADDCPASLVVNVDSGNDIFAIGEPIPIRVDLRMGEAQGDETVYISQFRHLLDCELGQSVEDCADPSWTGNPGNVISFVEGSEVTDCDVGDPPPPSALVAGEVDGTPGAGVAVDFIFNDGATPTPTDTPVVLDSTPFTPQDPPTYNTCKVTFDVMVEALGSTSAQLDVVEWSGFIQDWATCPAREGSPEELSAESFKQVGFRIANPNVVIWVTKDFTDNNKQGVDVHLRCDTGTILNPDFPDLTDPATDGTFETVGFVVYNIPSTGANCRVYEDPVPSGYAPSYLAGIKEAEDEQWEDYGELDDNQGCYFTAIKGGEYTCDVTNTGKPAEFTVYKEWLVNGDGGAEVLEEAEVTITCDREITANVVDEDSDENEVEGVVIPPLLVNGDWRMIGTLGDEEFMTALVDTVEDAADCYATEKVEASGVESIDDCEKPRELGPGESDDCKFTNTVFFEGIPTLNQYGMALMMLLMLGLAAFTFRRLV